MALFYFDFQFGEDAYHDEYGDAFDTVQEAVAQAQALLFDFVRDRLMGQVCIAACELRDDQGWVQYRAEISFRGESIHD